MKTGANVIDKRVVLCCPILLFRTSWRAAWMRHIGPKIFFLHLPIQALGRICPWAVGCIYGIIHCPVKCAIGRLFCSTKWKRGHVALSQLYAFTDSPFVEILPAGAYSCEVKEMLRQDAAKIPLLGLEGFTLAYKEGKLQNYAFKQYHQQCSGGLSSWVRGCQHSYFTALFCSLRLTSRNSSHATVLIAKPILILLSN